MSPADDRDRPEDRYSRQRRVDGIGTAGQSRIERSRVLVVGCGALGTHAAQTLVRAGVGTVHLVDRDVVEWSNLQRQVLFTERHADDGVPKAVAAAEQLRLANGDVAIHAHVADCSADFLGGLAGAVDLVLDGTDNFPTRYLINDFCRRHGLPWIYAGAVGSEGASMVVRADGPCLRCLWPDPPAQADVANCETAGVLEPAIAAVTAFQTAEALKLLAGVATTAGIFTCDVWRAHYAIVPRGERSADDCVVCRGERFPALTAPTTATASLCGRDAVQVTAAPGVRVDLDALAARLGDATSDLQRTPHLLRFTADGCRFSVFGDGRALLFGVHDPLRARALYDRWLA